MRKESRELLVQDWRDISFWDKLRSKVYKTPATFGHYSEHYSSYVKKILSSEDLEVVKVTKYTMYITCSRGSFEFKISNYPYAYGKLENLSPEHHWFHESLDWDAILKVRELQLQQRDAFFSQYDDKHSKL